MIVVVDCNVLVAWSTVKNDSPNKARLDALFDQIGARRLGYYVALVPALSLLLTAPIWARLALRAPPPPSSSSTLSSVFEATRGAGLSRLVS